jgi:signal transduction histidine kinase/DNA-binding response OmpR family regulator
VLAADVELSEITAFMKTVTVSANGVAFIVDRDGYLVASSTAAPFRMGTKGQERVSAAQSDSEIVRAVAAWWNSTPATERAGSEETAEQLRSPTLRNAKISMNGGDSIDVAARRLSRLDGVDWDVVVAIPRSDLTAPIVRSATLMFLVIILALAAALQLGLWIVRRVSRDVDELVKATRAYSASDGEFVEPRTTLQETSVLSDAFVGMFARLRESLATIRKQNEDLGALNTTLEERVVRRTRELESKNLELTAEVARREQLEVDLRAATEVTVKQADDKARFMAMLSHELRTPMQAVVGASELLARKSESNSDEARILDAASKSILTLVDGILSYSKLEAGKVTPLMSTFLVRDVVDEAIDLARAAQRECRPTITVSIDSVPQRIRTDAGMLRQVLVNLVTNAIKHARDGRIDVRLSRRPCRTSADADATNVSATDESDAFQLHVSVADNGPGIPENARHLLFQPFQQIGRGAADPSTGSGLGLAICAMLVRALYGDIRHVDRAQPGTEIEFDVRAETDRSVDTADSDSDPIVVPDVQPAAVNPRDVLLVDDHRVNLRLVNELLASQGHRAVLAESGEAAIAAVRERIAATQRGTGHAMFDVVFMDLNLPDISGIEAVAAIRELCRAQATSEPVFIALTASTSEEDVSACAAVGMTLRVTKPATLGTLQAVLQRAADASDKESQTAMPPESSFLIVDEAMLAQLSELENRSRQPFVARLVEDYLYGLDQEFASIVRAIEAHDTARAFSRAHALAGASASVGARALANALKAPQFGAQESEIPKLERCRIQTLRALRDWLANRQTVHGS